MASTRTRDAALTVVGFAAWLLYVLGCASFSPDDSKVLFPSNDPKTGGLVVAMYDRTARTTRALAALPVTGNPHDDQFCFRTGWTADGTHAPSCTDRVVAAPREFPFGTRLWVEGIGEAMAAGDGLTVLDLAQGPLADDVGEELASGADGAPGEVIANPSLNPNIPPNGGTTWPAR
jgi:3D (Asp-Asp-Asp) domain-containing protein